MTGPAELAPELGASNPLLGPVHAVFLRPGIHLTKLTLRRSRGVLQGANSIGRKLTRRRRPNSPRTTQRWWS